MIGPRRWLRRRRLRKQVRRFDAMLRTAAMMIEADALRLGHPTGPRPPRRDVYGRITEQGGIVWEDGSMTTMSVN